jgi:anti-anti-sigma regulatory factor
MTVRDALAVLWPHTREEADDLDVPDSQPVVIALISASYLVDSKALPRFSADLDRAVSSGATRLVVDLRPAGPVGTRAVNLLLGARERMLSKDGRIVLVAPPRLRRFCELTGLDRRFLLAGDRLEAAQMLGFLSRPDRHAA